MFKNHVIGTTSILQSLEIFPLIGFEGIENSPIDIRSSRINVDFPFWIKVKNIVESPEFSILVGGKKKMKFLNDDVANPLMVNRGYKSYYNVIDQLLNMDIPINLSEGEYDFPTNFSSIKFWVKK